MTIGVTPTGFVIETLDQIRTDMITKLKGRWGDSVDFGDESVAGQLIGIVAERYAKLQELAEAIYRSFGRDTATGDGLVNVNMLTGTDPRPAFPSFTVLSLTGTAGTLIDTGKQAETADGLVFETTDPVTLVLGLVRLSTTVYAVGTMRTANGNTYLVTVGGTTGNAGAAPSGTGDAIVDGTVTWRFVGAGLSYGEVLAVATENGPLQALSGALNEIKTPVSGWDGVINLLDADLGAYAETDESYRLRGELELAGAGSHTVDAIRADLLRLDGVTSVRVLQNTADIVVDTMPPHTVEALIQGGDNTEIATQLLELCVGVGYTTFGNTLVVVQDDLGNDYNVRFTRPTPVPIYVDVTLTYDADLYPDDGDAQVELAITAWGDARATGYDAVASAIAAQVFKVPGVLDVPSVKISLAPSPTLSTTIPIAIRELGTYDTSRIAVTSTPGTP